MTHHTEMQMPDDVMEAAIAAEKNMKFNGQTFVIAAIARAILQERERCARIAEEYTFPSRMNGLYVRNIQDKALCPPCKLAAKIRSVDK